MGLYRAQRFKRLLLRENKAIRKTIQGLKRVGGGLPSVHMVTAPPLFSTLAATLSATFAHCSPLSKAMLEYQQRFIKDLTKRACRLRLAAIVLHYALGLLPGVPPTAPRLRWLVFTIVNIVYVCGSGVYMCIVYKCVHCYKCCIVIGGVL